MVVFPNAKINLGLNIVSKREDGYHDISSCLFPVPLTDILEIQPGETLTFNTTGITIPDEEQNNLCIEAFELLNRDFDLQPVNIHLHKMIPVGAGLGGGSSDASFTLKCLNELFKLERTDDQLEHYAAQLGSDCPFFIKNHPALAEGTGQDLELIDIDLTGRYLVLVNSDIHVSTPEAYSRVVPKIPAQPISEIVIKPLEIWQSALKNDFEPSVFNQFPKIRKLKEQLIESGAVYASMSGSGSSVYGLFNEKKQLPAELENSIIWQGEL